MAMGKLRRGMYVVSVGNPPPCWSMKPPGAWGVEGSDAGRRSDTTQSDDEITMRSTSFFPLHRNPHTRAHTRTHTLTGESIDTATIGGSITAGQGCPDFPGGWSQSALPRHHTIEMMRFASSLPPVCASDRRRRESPHRNDWRVDHRWAGLPRLSRRLVPVCVQLYAGPLWERQGQGWVQI
jgi:hypothetical protein